MSLRMGAYRLLQGWLVEPWLLPRWMSEERIESEHKKSLSERSLPPRRPGVTRAWFHAASVGELESLTPVIERWLQDGSEALLTVLSESAGRAVDKLASSTDADRVLFHGYSPWEGRWGDALRRSEADVFVTAKYEAWPELWASLAEQDIPLVVVGAKARRSLRLAGKLCSLLGGKIPKLTLLCAREQDTEELRQIFAKTPGVQVRCTGEPRWDRVSARAKAGSARAKELIERYKDRPKPWGVLAQVWPDDMEVWRGELGRRQGTLWVVPHKVDREHVAEVEEYLNQAGVPISLTSEASKASPQSDQAQGCVLVDEIGVLLELYSAVDWAYVGGGFGVGVHSTIEPALYGVPVACGPSGEDKFSEIAELKSTNQLTVVHDREELAEWIEKVLVDDAQRGRWKADAAARLGATRHVLDAIRGSC